MKKGFLFLVITVIFLSGCSNEKQVSSSIMTEEEIAAFRDTHKQIEKTFALVDMEKYPVEYYLDNGCNYAVVEFVEELPSETVYLNPGNEGEKALAKKAGISAYSATKRHFCFRYIRTVIEGAKENAVKGFENWEFEDFVLQDNEIKTYIAAAWNVLDFIPGEQYLFLITPFKSEEELELITDYSYYVTEDEHIVAAIYDDGEEYTGYSLENFEKQVTDRIKVYEEEKEQKK